MKKRVDITLIIVSMILLVVIADLAAGCNTSQPTSQTRLPPNAPSSAIPTTPTTTPPSAGTNVGSNNSDNYYQPCCQETVTRLRSLTGNLKIPDHLLKYSPSNSDNSTHPVKQGGEFDPNLYLEVLTHLKLQNGFVLDYVYDLNSLGGAPLLYARPVDQEPYLTSKDFYAAQPAHFLSRIVVDDSPEGFLQFAILDVMGPQFYLFWHANYNYKEVLCGSDDIEQVISENAKSNFGSPLNSKQIWQARAIADPSPRVEIKAEEVSVSLLMFTYWGGFYRRTYTIKRAFPHDILDVQDKNLVPFNCGFMF